MVHWARKELAKQDLPPSRQQAAGLGSMQMAMPPAPMVVDTQRGLPKLAARLDLHQDNLQELQVGASAAGGGTDVA